MAGRLLSKLLLILLAVLVSTLLLPVLSFDLLWLLVMLLLSNRLALVQLTMSLLPVVSGLLQIAKLELLLVQSKLLLLLSEANPVVMGTLRLGAFIWEALSESESHRGTTAAISTAAEELRGGPGGWRDSEGVSLNSRA